MKSMSNISKETFFLETLVPTGLVAELLVGKTVKKYGKDENVALGVAVWEPLNLVSHYILSPKANAASVTPLRKAVLQYRAILLELLNEQLPGVHPRHKRLRRNSLEFNNALREPRTDIERLVGLADIEDKLKLEHKGKAPGYKERWVAEHVNALLPASMKSPSKWRTFARNLEPQKTAREFGLDSSVVTEAKNLASHGGEENARRLWQACFTAQDSSKESRSTRKALPEDVSVVVLPSGFMEVVATFHPRTRLSIKIDVQTLPADLFERLSVQRTRVECGYEDLARSVKKAIAWLDEQHAGLAQLKADYDATLAKNQADALEEKLKSTFSPEEIEVLRKRMVAA